MSSRKRPTFVENDPLKMDSLKMNLVKRTTP